MKCYVIPTEKCSSDCIFCITKSRDYSKKLKRSEDIIFLKTEVDIVSALKNQNIKVFEITGGGEPFLDKKLATKIKTIKQIIPDSYIKIYTNGNHLKKLVGVDEINISVSHYNDEINKKIMRPLGIYVPFLKKLEYFKENYPEAKIRLSIPLLKSGINSETELKELLKITKDFNLEYVVRTIYPKTPNYKANYVDVNYEHPKINYERDNTVNDFDGVIWWSNNELYSNWNLNQKKHLFSYVLLKPGSQIHINEILKILDDNDYAYQIRKYFDFNETIYLYRNHPEHIKKVIKNHLKSLSILFGSEYLVLFLNKNQTFKETVLEMLEIKQKIRSEYSFNKKHDGYILYENYQLKNNLIHSPDYNEKKINEDLDYLEQLKFNPINQSKLKLIKKYRTFKI